MKKLLIITLLIYAGIGLNARTVNVSDFGVYPDSFKDATEGVKQAIDECRQNPGSTLVFPKGRYDFWPCKAEQREYFVSNTTSETECPSKVKSIALLFENVNDITVEGNGSLFIFHGKIITFGLDGCGNMTIRNISVDFERPSMTEISIEELYPDYMISRIHPDSKYTVTDGKIYFYGEGWSMDDNFFSILTDTVAGTSVYSSWEPVQKSKAIELEPFRVKFEGDFSKVNYSEGQVLTTRNHIRDHVGLFVNRSKNITLNNITLHYMHGLGIVSQFSENLTYNKVNITPLRGRTIAAFADGMHFSGCKGHIEIRDCRFKGLHDDPVNVHGTYLKISKVNSPDDVILRFMHSQTYGMQPFFDNDTVAFIQSKTLGKIDYAIVKGVEKISEREVRVKLSKPLPRGIGEGDCIENITWTPSLHVSGCRMEMTNTRGLLVTTPKKVVIEDNYFYRVGMHAIQIAADANSWYESGAVNDVLIQNNVFDAGGYNLSYDNDSYVIAIVPENHESKANHWVHHNIRIENNVFKVYPDNLIMKAKSTANLYFGNNIIEKADFTPLLKNRTKKKPENPSFKINGCTKVRIEKNVYNVPASSVRVECVNMKKKDIQVEKPLAVTF